MIKDPVIGRAISSIRERADRQADPQKLVGAFVDVGLLNQVQNANNQIIFGRRGTGKTHVFKVLEARLDHGTPVLYLDARTLGSSTQFSDLTLPLPQRCIALFRDMLGEIHNALLDTVVECPTEISDAALPLLERFGAVATQAVARVDREQIGTKSSTKKKDGTQGSLSLSPDHGLKLNVAGKNEATEEQETTRKLSVTEEDKVVFPAIYQLLRSLLTTLHCTFYILIDEWSSFPLDVQPYLAEFIKRSLLPNPAIVVKIASLEHRSNFNITHRKSLIGFELGSDIGTSVNIDDYYVYDRDPAKLLQTFSDILMKHLRSELPSGYLETKYGIAPSNDLYPVLFQNKGAFQDLVRASEGVVRDLIHVFAASYFSAQIKNQDCITKGNVQRAARAWFQKDKAQNLDEKTRSFLDDLCTTVIGRHEVRVFLVGAAFERHPMLESLLDLRVLHLLRRGYADPKRPGLRYSVFTLDYGTYVEQANTVMRPMGFVRKAGRTSKDEVIVPFDDDTRDDRYVKNVVIPATFFEKYNSDSAPSGDLYMEAGHEAPRLA